VPVPGRPPGRRRSGRVRYARTALRPRPAGAAGRPTHGRPVAPVRRSRPDRRSAPRSTAGDRRCVPVRRGSRANATVEPVYSNSCPGAPMRRWRGFQPRWVATGTVTSGRRTPATSLPSIVDVGHDTRIGRAVHGGGPRADASRRVGTEVEGSQDGQLLGRGSDQTGHAAQTGRAPRPGRRRRRLRRGAPARAAARHHHGPRRRGCATWPGTAGCSRGH